MNNEYKNILIVFKMVERSSYLANF